MKTTTSSKPSSPRSTRYSSEQISFILAATQTMSFCDAVKGASIATLYEDLQTNVNDAEVLKNVRHLLFKIYEFHSKKQWLTKTQACNYVGSLNRNSCFRYIARAKSLGFFQFQRSSVDKRKIYIVPNDQLLDFVENEIDQEADCLRTLFLELLKRGPLPNDKKPMQGMTLDKTIARNPASSNDDTSSNQFAMSA